MAETAGTSGTGRQRGRRGADRDRIIDAALDLAAERGWAQVSLLDIARRAEVPLAELYTCYPGKHEILAAFSRRLDEAVLADQEMEEAQAEGEPARDRLFDVLMRRFDRLQPHRKAVESILDAYRRDPALAVGGLLQLRRSMSWMLEAAGLSTSGLRGEMRLDGLCAIYLATLRSWLRDDTEDMAKTMASLDGYLRRIERPVAMLEGLRLRDRGRHDAGADRGSADF